MYQKTKNRAVRLIGLASLTIGLGLIGCGGGGGANSGAPVSTQTTHIGPIAVSFSGRPQAPVTGTSGQVSAVGQAGASYNSLSVNPAKSLDSTFLAFTRGFANFTDEVYTLPAVGNSTPNVLIHSGETAYPSFSQSGVMAVLTGSLSTYSIATLLSDGSQQKTVIPYLLASPSISPNGATIIYSDDFGNVNSIPSGGGTPTIIFTGSSGAGGTSYAYYAAEPVWSPSGNQVAFTAISVATGCEIVYTMSPSGASLTNVTPTAYSAGNLAVTGWSPDGASLVCTYKASGATNTSIALISVIPGYNSTLSPTTFSDSAGCFSPDGRHLAFYRSNAGGAIPGIYVSDGVGVNPQMLLADPSNSGPSGSVLNIAWSPFLEAQTFVGPHGTITASPVAGFLASQNGSQFASLLTFTATTPSTATITQSAVNQSGAPLVFTLGADSITNISYTNTYNGAHTTIPLAATPTTIVTIDGTTGLVDFVVPALAVKGQAMAMRKSGTAFTYTGRFAAIYDGKGKNLAPNGAASVKFDSGTGRLISFQ